MSEPVREPEHLWEQGWEGHSEAQRRRLARLPLREKLQWLEDAQRLVTHLARARQSREGAESAGPARRDSED